MDDYCEDACVEFDTSTVFSFTLMLLNTLLFSRPFSLLLSFLYDMAQNNPSIVIYLSVPKLNNLNICILSYFFLFVKDQCTPSFLCYFDCNEHIIYLPLTFQGNDKVDYQTEAKSFLLMQLKALESYPSNTIILMKQFKLFYILIS